MALTPEKREALKLARKRIAAGQSRYICFALESVTIKRPDLEEAAAELKGYIHKGDPRDVAAYCAFLWHHNESTAPAPADERAAFEAWRDKRAFNLPSYGGLAEAYAWDAWQARASSPNAAGAEGAKPTAWVRFRSDGGFEGPIMDTDERMCDTRRKSGAWTPLFLGPAQESRPLSIPAGWMLIPKHRGTKPLAELIIAASLACVENRLMDDDDRHELAQFADQLQHALKTAPAQAAGPVAIPACYTQAPLALLPRVADLLHLLSFATIHTPSEGDEPQIRRTLHDIKAMIAAAPASAPVGLTEQAIADAVAKWFPDRAYQAPSFASELLKGDKHE
ncbi:hypothetical protein KTE49_20560 [Burkholderia multivorans]|uniref:hypothetical protein n=1 Tax=Burkholderia multivorans TaxID=87883 RepID=UPI001C269655|nr:hypothetical protein [Burkholderia multivorans]MBU9532830.1 hypothetical protein [Burkholderia multivorans]